MSTPTTWPEGDVREQRRTRTADPGVPGSVPESNPLAIDIAANPYKQDFPLLADRALLETVGATNPRPFDRADVIALYEEAF